MLFVYSVRVGRVGMRADKMDMEADLRAQGVSQEEGNEDEEEEDDDDDDDERLRLDELLDELDLLGDEDDHDHDHNQQQHDNMMGEEDVSSIRILTVEEANSIAPLQLPTTGFDMADYASDQFKFT